MNERAILYRQKYRIPDEWGTAVNVQSMVFGNMGDDCATGVAFTRDPATGENVFYGEYLVNAQGEDVVAGVRTPKKIAEMAKDRSSARRSRSSSKSARRWRRTSAMCRILSSRSKRKSCSCCRPATASGPALAYVKIAHDMVKERLMTPEHAIRSGDPGGPQSAACSRSSIAMLTSRRKNEGRLMATGIPAGPARRPARSCSRAGKAEELADAGQARRAGPHRNQPRRSSRHERRRRHSHRRGGVSSHAALVARQMGKVCVAGAGDIHIDYARRHAHRAAA